MLRRNFFQGLLGLLGVGATKTIGSEPIVKEDQYLLNITVNVGEMPAHKVGPYMDRFQDQVKKKIPKNWTAFLIPTRNQPSSINLQYKNSTGYVDVDQLTIDLREIKNNLVKADINREKIKDHILLMLGSPAITIELDMQQLDLCVDKAFNEVLEAYQSCSGISRNLSSSLVEEGALAYAKCILGMVRKKYSEYPGPLGAIDLDGENLYSQGKEELQAWQEKLEIL